MRCFLHNNFKVESSIKEGKMNKGSDIVISTGYIPEISKELFKKDLWDNSRLHLVTAIHII